jgi:hypothetical protein
MELENVAEQRPRASVRSLGGLVSMKYELRNFRHERNVAARKGNVAHVLQQNACQNRSVLSFSTYSVIVGI